jgi:hypothetical protein
MPSALYSFYYFGSREGHEYPVLHRLFNNSISGYKENKKKAFKTFKLKKK